MLAKRFTTLSRQIVLGIFWPLVICLMPNVVWAAPANLKIVHAEIVADFPEVEHLEPAQLTPILGSEQLVLFDVREINEYNVSRLPGAFRLSPQTSLAEFHRRFGDQIVGQTIVFYCSVGVRSSKMAERLLSGLNAMGASRVYNLKGGIFSWHNEGRTLVNDAGYSKFVHPFNEQWGQLINRPELLRYRHEP